MHGDLTILTCSEPACSWRVRVRRRSDLQRGWEVVPWAEPKAQPARLDRSCSAPGCKFPVKACRLCAGHYKAWSRLPEPRPLVEAWIAQGCPSAEPEKDDIAHDATKMQQKCNVPVSAALDTSPLTESSDADTSSPALAAATITPDPPPEPAPAESTAAAPAAHCRVAGCPNPPNPIGICRRCYLRWYAYKRAGKPLPELEGWIAAGGPRCGEPNNGGRGKPRERVTVGSGGTRDSAGRHRLDPAPNCPDCDSAGELCPKHRRDRINANKRAWRRGIREQEGKPADPLSMRLGTALSDCRKLAQEKREAAARLIADAEAIEAAVAVLEKSQ